MKYLLDTNICIYLIKQQPAAVLQRFSQHEVGEIGISSITVAELFFGVEKSQQATQNRQALAQFLLPLILVPFEAQAALAYGKVRAALEAQGQPIGPLDTLIGAHALSLDVTLVTNNTREFNRIAGLSVENWVTV